MAGKPKKKSAKKAKPSGPAPCAVLWGLGPAGTVGGAGAADSAGPADAVCATGPAIAEGATVRAVLREMGVVARTATYERLGDPAGAFARLPGFRPAPVPYAGPTPACDEFVLLCGLTDAQVNEFLARSREAGCVVGPKALLTKTSRSWPLARLIEAVAAEHAAQG